VRGLGHGGVAGDRQTSGEVVLRLSAAAMAGSVSAIMSTQTTILIVDDEPAVRQVGALALRGADYEILEAPGGEVALAMLAERPDVAIVMLDCKMPHMTGPELARAILARRPGMKLVAVSGEPCDCGMPAEASFLQKPYRPSTLRAHIAERLRP